MSVDLFSHVLVVIKYKTWGFWYRNSTQSQWEGKILLLFEDRIEICVLYGMVSGEFSVNVTKLTAETSCGLRDPMFTESSCRPTLKSETHRH